MLKEIHAHTWFELDPHSGISLDLLDHLTTPADDNPHCKPGYSHLKGGIGLKHVSSNIKGVFKTAP
jgi:hypothetical protein